MSYSVVAWRGFFYIKWSANDPKPTSVGPYRFETDARRVADELNAKEKLLEPIAAQ